MVNFKSSELPPIFLGIIAGIFVAYPIFNPFNVTWLGGSLDPAQQYLGWALFRAGPWSFPIGLNPFNGLEFSNSIVFSDSIPIFAFIFKLISPFLPLQFQYFGFWTLICFVLQAWFAWKLIGLITLNKWIQWLSSGFFVFSPPMLVRVGLHTALVSHFLILAALYLIFRSNQKKPHSMLVIFSGYSVISPFLYIGYDFEPMDCKHD